MLGAVARTASFRHPAFAVRPSARPAAQAVPNPNVCDALILQFVQTPQARYFYVVNANGAYSVVSRDFYTALASYASSAGNQDCAAAAQQDQRGWDSDHSTTSTNDLSGQVQAFLSQMPGGCTSWIQMSPASKVGAIRQWYAQQNQSQEMAVDDAVVFMRAIDQQCGSPPWQPTVQPTGSGSRVVIGIGMVGALALLVWLGMRSTS